jgi:hypothetical protein
MSETTQRFDVGFIGGGTTSGTVSAEEWARLEAAFSGAGDAVIRLEENGAALWVRASQIAWARLHTRDARIGF